MKKFLLATTMLIACSLAALAADVSGKWTAQVPGRGGQTREVTFTLKADGDKLTGSMTGFQGMEIPLTEGKVAGDTISFVTVVERNGNTNKSSYTGAVAGDEIKFKVEGGRGGPQEFAAKRAK
jgi:opacity protein-like surface antigen